MFRPERMTSVSLICLKRDVDKILESLNGFGEFHIEQAEEIVTSEQLTQSIQKIEAVRADISDLERILNTEKPRLTDIFRKEEPTRTKITVESWQALSEHVFLEIAALKTETSKHTVVLSSLSEEDAKLARIREMLTVMDDIEFDLAVADKLNRINVIAANIPTKDLADLEHSLSGVPLILHRCHLAKETQFFCAAFPSRHREEIEKSVKLHHGEIFTIPQELPHDVTRALEEVNKKVNQNSAEEKKLKEKIEKIGESNKSKLTSLRETSLNILVLLQAERKIIQSGRLATIKGFVPKHQFHFFQEKISSKLNGNIIVIENEVAAIEDPPTRIVNNRFVKPFEEITKLYGVPHYDELDPTPILAITFPLIFGLMFGDVGHGLVLLLGGLAFGFLIKRNSAIKNVCWILAACGIGAIISGVLYGEVFGLQAFAPLWFNPFDNVLSFLIFSLIVGVVQIMSGLVLDMINFLLKHNFVDALLTTVPKIAFYLGGIYLIAVHQLNFGAWLSGPIFFALVPFLILVFGKTIAFRTGQMLIGSEVRSGKQSLGERFFESSDFVARLMSNTMSYTRILALLMAHWALILVTYVVAGLVGSATPLNSILSGIVVIGGNLFVIALEGLIVFIHSLRLHFYEWFSKFYQGNGAEFSPFKQKFVYTELKFNKEEKGQKN